MMSIYSTKEIERFFQEKAELFKTEDFGSGVVVYWKGAQSIPSMRAVSFFQKNTNEELIPNVSEEAFLLFFKKLELQSYDANDICELLHWASPYLRKAIAKKAPYLTCIANRWHIPFVTTEGQFEGYFDNLTKGVIERITLSKDSSLSIEEMGEGLKL